MMKLSGKGLCAVLSSFLLFVCALSQVVVGLRCVSLGSALRAHFHLGAAAGAFYSGLLVGFGLVLLGSALLCSEKPGCRNFFLLGVLVFLLGILTAFSGAVVDGDTASVVERKYSHYCFHLVQVSPACEQLREYQRGLVVSTGLSCLNCVLGLLTLLLIRRYRAEQITRNRRCPRRGAGSVLFSEEVHFQPVSYINLGVFNVMDETGAEVQCGGHPSIELPGYSTSDPDLNHCFPFSYPIPSELPPAYEDIFPAVACS
ncbi:transmembrane protein 271 [Gouania willdenowi]|uniref:transmembrane protein 271 n=1 Tax=Gouania willdenowi TaxID=441366 RepID=UPI0010547AFC|nr:transmembrane protein 271-like [Gouania willdenowi]